MRSTVGMDDEQAGALARSWIDAWNAHDLDRVLDHFSHDVVFTSPLVTTLVGDPSGAVTGKEQLRAYWRAGLERNEGLHFELERVYTGVDTIGIAYTNHNGRSCLETGVVGDDGRITRGWAFYG